MDINNNQHQNTFESGMNTDTSDSLISSNQYRLAKNMRLITTGNNNSAELHFIEGTARVGHLKISSNGIAITDYQIIAVDHIRNRGIIIAQKDSGWNIFVFDDSNDTNAYAIFNNDITELLGNNVSTVTRYESDDLYKLYIADGVHPILLVNVAGDYTKDENKKVINNIYEISTYPQISLNKIEFQGYIEGNLKVGKYQYAYRLYNRYGVASEMSIPTNMIPVFNLNKKPSIDYYTSYKAGTLTTTGISLKITNDSEQFNKIQVYRIYYETLEAQPLIELIQDSTFVKSIVISDVGQDAISTLTVEEFNSSSGLHIIPKVIESKHDYMFAANIKDADADLDKTLVDFDTRAYSFEYEKDGINTNIHLNIDGKQFSDVKEGSFKDMLNNAKSILPLVDKEADCITSGDSHFGIAIDDESSQSVDIVYGGIGLNIQWMFVTTDMHTDSSVSELNGKTDIFTKEGISGIDIKNYMLPYNKYYQQHVGNTNPMIRHSYGRREHTLYYIDVNGTLHSSKLPTITCSDTYNDPECVLKLKSLHRGETYRYGIVFYDKFGRHSSTKWITDIKVPDLTVKGFDTFGRPVVYNGYTNNTTDLDTYPLGVYFRVNIPSEYKDIIDKYEIVRCTKSLSNSKILSQGVLSRPICKQIRHTAQNKATFPYCPTGLITTGRYWTGFNPAFITNTHLDDDTTDPVQWCADNFQNANTYQFISPEVLYISDFVSSSWNDLSLSIQSQRYLFGMNTQQGFYVHDSDHESMKNNASYRERACFTNHGVEIGNNAAIYLGNLQNSGSSSNVARDAWVNYGNGTSNLGLDVMYMKFGLPITSCYRNAWFTAFYAASANTGANLCTLYLNNNAYSFEKKYNAINTDRWRDTNSSNQFSYIKLYEQSDSVTYRGYGIDGAGETSSGFYNGYYNKGNAGNISKEITSFKIPDCYDYNQLWQHVDTNGGGLKMAQDKNVYIGDSMFNNIVAAPFYVYDSQNNDSQLISDDYLYPTTYSEDNFTPITRTYPMGVGGKCMVIKTNDNIYEQNSPTFHNTSAALNRFEYQVEGGHIIRKELTPTSNNNTVFNDTENAQMLMDTVSYQDGTANLISNNKHTIASVRGGYDYYKNSNSGELYPIYKSSVAGTYLCNIINKNANLYGGDKYQSRKYNTYYSYGNVQDVNGESTNLIVFDGDTYIQPFEYISMHKYTSTDNYIQHPITNCIVYSIPVESYINTEADYGCQFSRTVLNDYNQQNTYMQINPVKYQSYTQTKSMYRNNNIDEVTPIKTYTVADTDTVKESSQLDYRCYYSNVKENNESIDSWCKFMPSNYIDVDTRYGSINKMLLFNDNLMFWQTNSFGKFDVNEQSLIQDSNNTNLILGTSGVLQRYTYLSILYGLNNINAVTKSDNAIYWYDRQNILQFSGNGLVELSTAKNVSDYVKSITDFYKNIQFAYDIKHKEILMYINNGESLVYNENQQCFTSIYQNNDTSENTYKNNVFTTLINDTLYSVKHDGVYKSMKYTDNQNTKRFDYEIHPYVKYIVNKVFQSPKTFDIQTMGLSTNNKDAIKLNYYTKNTNTSTYQTSNTTGDYITNREYDYRVDIPRNDNADYGQRMRGKTLVCEIEQSGLDNDFSLLYIITKYRISWS